MSKAEKFIEERTKKSTNEIGVIDATNSHHYHEWLTPKQARMAVEIAREEMIERACSFVSDNIGEYIELKHANPAAFIKIDGDRFINDLKQAMKDE